MVVEPKFRNNIFMNAHPAGCAAEVGRQIDWVRSRARVDGPKRVLVVGSSTGYGLASRIVAAFGAGASTVGVAFEKEGSEKRTGTAGWYNTKAFDERARRTGLVAESINADAFSDAVKSETVRLVKEKLGEVDLLVYSLASPVRTDPKSGELYRSVLKPIGTSYSAQSVDMMSGEIKEFSVDAATAEEIAQTEKVMGGEDWTLWIDALEKGGVIGKGMKTVAFSYIGPSVTSAIYRAGTIGRAKEHLEHTAHELSKRLASKGGSAYVSVNKAVVTRSSAVIPVVPLYISILFKVMKQKGVHEGCIEQMYRLFAERLYAGGSVPVDDEGRIRLDDLEMRDDVQREVTEVMKRVSTQNFSQVADVEGYRRDFFQIHGFDVEGVDYAADVAT
ncbi:MAG TPA: enoyl-ACP reductase FabV [Spirochaetia bacterium]|nr:enoyl-ACP reductase FabV [Spirochaetia bacterium]